MRRAVLKSLHFCGYFLIVSFAVLSFANEGLSQQDKPPYASKVPGSRNEPPSAEPTPKPLSDLKITFDTDEPGVAFVESGGEMIRIDTNRMTVATVENPILRKAANVAAAEPKLEAPTGDDLDDFDPYEFDKGDEPYAERVVNVPTPKHVPKGSWNLAFTHRFTQQIDPIGDSARNLFGLDSFGIASFGVTYGITDKLYASAYRSPVCQRGMCKVIEVGVGYNWIAQDAHMPIGLSTYASIEGNDNFTEEYTYNLQAMLSGRIGKRVFLFFSPAAHFNSNGERRFDPRATDFFPPATVANSFRQPVHSATFGFGASVMITPNVVALFDVAARTGFKLGRVRPILNSSFQVVGFTAESHPSIGFGVQRNVGKHSFALTFSNTQTTTTSRYGSSNLFLSPKRLIIGFNLSRRF